MIADVVTLGLFGDKTKIPTLGFTIGAPPSPSPAIADLVTFGFHGNAAKIPTLGFTIGAPFVPSPSESAAGDIIMLGFRGDSLKIPTLGFGPFAQAEPSIARLVADPWAAESLPAQPLPDPRAAVSFIPS